MVRFDAYTATTLAAKTDDLVQILCDRAGPFPVVATGRGFHTFGQRLTVKDSGGHEIGAVQWGGTQGSRLMFEVKGESSQKAVEALRSRFEHRVTRVDACADFDEPGAFEALLKPCVEVKKDRRIMGGKFGDWDDFPEKGRTLYLGSTKSPVRIRLYEKGLQLEYLHLSRPDWSRLEVQVRPEKDARGSFSELSPIDVWGASRWTRDIAAKVLQHHVDPHPAGTVYRLTDDETALRWMCKQYGHRMTSLAENLGGWDCVGLTIRDTIAELRRGR
jgi:DNA relaxase NicK